MAIFFVPGLRSWDLKSTHVDLTCELLNLANAAPEGDEGRNGKNSMLLTLSCSRCVNFYQESNLALREKTLPANCRPCGFVQRFLTIQVKIQIKD